MYTDAIQLHTHATVLKEIILEAKTGATEQLAQLFRTIRERSELI